MHTVVKHYVMTVLQQFCHVLGSMKFGNGNPKLREIKPRKASTQKERSDKAIAHAEAYKNLVVTWFEAQVGLAMLCRTPHSSAIKGQCGKELLSMICQLIPESLSCASIVHKALSCLAAMIAVIPIPDRAAFAQVVTSGTSQSCATDWRFKLCCSAGNGTLCI